MMMIIIMMMIIGLCPWLERGATIAATAGGFGLEEIQCAHLHRRLRFRSLLPHSNPC